MKNILPLPANVALLRPYESARSIRKGDAWTFLDANESPFVDAVNIDVWPPMNRYPDPTADALRDSIAATYGVERGNLLMTNGSDELIDLLVRSFVRPGRKVVGLFPSYGMYRVAAESNGKLFSVVSLRSDFSVDEDVLFIALEGADLLFLCSPNNPTGTILPVPLLERVLDGFSGLVVVDEAYGEFADSAGIPSAIDLVKREAKNLIVMRTFSKAFGAAGIRLGYGIADPLVIDVLLRMKAPYNVNVLSQAAGLALWKSWDVMERNVRLLISERERVAGECRRLRCKVFPSMANFLLLQLPEGVCAQKIYDDLIERDRLVIRRFAAIPAWKNVVRVSIGSPAQNDLFLRSLPRFLP